VQHGTVSSADRLSQGVIEHGRLIRRISMKTVMKTNKKSLKKEKN